MSQLLLRMAVSHRARDRTARPVYMVCTAVCVHSTSSMLFISTVDQPIERVAIQALAGARKQTKAVAATVKALAQSRERG